MNDQPNIQLTRREFYVMMAALLATEDAPDAFRASLGALKQPPSSEREVCELGERLLAQLDPGHTL